MGAYRRHGMTQERSMAAYTVPTVTLTVNYTTEMLCYYYYAAVNKLMTLNPLGICAQSETDCTEAVQPTYIHKHMFKAIIRS